MMRICHFSSVHPELDTRIFYRECLSLAKAEYQVCLLGPWERNRLAYGIQIIRWQFKGNNRLLRVLQLPSILVPLLKQQASIYHFHDPELIPIGVLLKLLFRKRVIYDIHEDYPSMMKLKFWIPGIMRNIISRCVYWGEQIAGQALDGIVTADPYVLQMFPHVPSKHKIVFYNFPTLEMLRETAHLSCNKIYDIVYVGGMSDRAGTYILIEAVHQLANRGLKSKVLLIGYFDNAAAENNIRKEITRLSLSELIEIKGRVPHKEVLGLLSQGRIGVVALQPVEKFLKNIPSKLFEYWACGLPVVSSNLPPIRPFFQDGNYGFLVEPTKPEAFAEAFAWLLTHPNIAEQMGKEAQQAVFERFNCEAESKRLVQLYAHIMKGK